MAETIRGIVEEVMNNGVGKGSGIRIEGKKYGVYDPGAAKLGAVNVGQEVSFRYTERPDKANPSVSYKNISGAITVVAAGSGGATVGASSVPSNINSVSLSRDRAIIRQNALTNAVKVVTEIGDQYGIIGADGNVVDAIISTAMKFEEYTSGDMDKNIMAEVEAGFNPED